MVKTGSPYAERGEVLSRLLRERIVILDGAMGTMIQTYKLDEAGYRGQRFKDWAKDVKGNNDLLNLTQPSLIQGIHRQYFEAGADIIETNTFNSTTISLADYGMESLAFELNLAGAKNARAAADAVMTRDAGRTCFVAGAIGPTSKTASISGNVSDPAARGVTYDQLVEAYYEQARALLEGGADLLLVETVFDSLNSKAALFAIARLFDELGRQVPVMLSFTITDLSGRTLSGQTVEAYWNSVSHFPLLSIGINCALGPKEMRPFIEELSGIAPIYVSAYPNAGLPNPMLPTGFPETPETLAPQLAEWAKAGWLNIVGGCCGTTAGAHQGRRAGGERSCTARPAKGRALSAAERIGAADDPARHQFRQHWRAHQRDRFAQVRQAHPGRSIRGSAGCGQAAGRQRRADH